MKKIEYEGNSNNSMYLRKETGNIINLYNSKRNFSGRCCKTVSSEACMCDGEHCARAI